MIKDNLQLLDINEHSRQIYTNRFETVLKICKVHDLTLDLATSDVVIYLRDKWGGEICLK